jgi:glycosyltransferase involved in cell wall biosynthesis
MRYMWDRFDQYFGPGQAGLAVRSAARLFRPRLRRWDRSVSGPDRVDAIVGNSRFIAERIREAYGREAGVVHPFADFSRFTSPRGPGAAYLIVGAFAPYKRVDLAVEACSRLGLPLKVVGTGPDLARLKEMAGPSVQFLGRLPDAEVTRLMANCKAFLFPGEEDFGIAPVEAMACGTPVIALGRGGAAETVAGLEASEPTGVLFGEQSAAAIAAAVRTFEANAQRITAQACRARAERYSAARSRSAFMAFVTRRHAEWRQRR